MQFVREINRLLLGVFLAFVVVALAASYWAVVGADTVLRRTDNPRAFEAEASIVRGDLYDRDAERLVESVRGENGFISRRYLHPSMYSAIGYYSLRYGVGGAESAFNTVLRGDDLPRDPTTIITDNLLHRAREGSDVMLTFDLDIQRALAEAMEGQRGAAVVLGVGDGWNGDILAMVSLPTYDPNTLNTTWDVLTTDEGQPFFNRVLQGSYQPGAAIQTLLMSAAVLVDVPLDSEIENATTPVDIDGVTVGCAVPLPFDVLTLGEAYAFACPAPFAGLAETLGEATIQATFDTFRLDQPPTLPGFIAVQNSGTPTPTTPATPTATGNSLIRNALGQGNLTVTPLTMATIAGGIINDGNAPQPHVLLRRRAPESEDWSSAEPISPTTPISTANTARALQDLMRGAVNFGAAGNAARSGIDIGGHVARARAGDTSLAWFVGFATLDQNRAVAVAVVLEDNDDLGLAADIGGTALAAAHAAANRPPTAASASPASLTISPSCC